MQNIRRLLIFSSLALVLSGGAAFADHWRGGGGGGYARGGYVSRPAYNRTYVAPRASFSSGYRGGYYGGGYARRPIYMGGPVIRDHYYDYYRRPSLIVENYGPMDGYVWVRGQWTWNGYEWMWQPGHYQPIW